LHSQLAPQATPAAFFATQLVPTQALVESHCADEHPPVHEPLQRPEPLQL